MSDEHGEQVAVIDWARRQAGLYPCLSWLHSSLNGAKLPWRKNEKGQRYSPEAMKQKAAGMTPGIPDLFLPFPARGYHGLYIEMKAPGKMQEVRDGQIAFMAYAESVGYLCQVCDGADLAIELIQWYIGIKV
jgi:hypothetical protein